MTEDVMGEIGALLDKRLPTLHDRFMMAAFPVVAVFITAATSGHVRITKMDGDLDEAAIASMASAIADACMKAREVK